MRFSFRFTGFTPASTDLKVSDPERHGKVAGISRSAAPDLLANAD